MKVQHETLQTQTEQLLEDIAFEIFIGKTIYHEQFKQMSLEYDPHDGMDFDCEKMRLTSLEGVPQSIGRSFSCSDNQLTSLKGAPQYVRESFFCNNNQLTSLKGAPQSVGDSFYCKNNQLTTLEGAPQYVPGYFSCDNNQLTSLKGAPQSVGLRFSCYNNPKLSEAQIAHYEEFLTGMHQECLVDWHYMPPEKLK